MWCGFVMIVMKFSTLVRNILFYFCPCNTLSPIKHVKNTNQHLNQEWRASIYTIWFPQSLALFIQKWTKADFILEINAICLYSFIFMYIMILERTDFILIFNMNNIFLTHERLLRTNMIRKCWVDCRFKLSFLLVKCWKQSTI